MSTRASFPTPRQAQVLLALSLGLVLYGWTLARAGAGPWITARAGSHNDVEMYRDVARAVHAGEPYYATALRELTEGGYATKPFWNFRLPTLAYLGKALPDPTQLSWLLQALGVSSLLLWVLAIRRASGRSALFAAVPLLLPSLIITLTPNGFWLHETWAGMLISLSLALDALQRPRESVLAGLAAAGVRELGVLHALVRAALGWREPRSASFLGWCLALVAIAGLLAWHAARASSFVLPGAIEGPSWVAWGGYRFLLAAVHQCSALVIAPPWLTALVLPLCLFGFAAGSSGATRKVGPVVLAYCAAWLCVGRPNNHYWGHLIAPLLPLGLLQLPEALRRTRAATVESAAGAPT